MTRTQTRLWPADEIDGRVERLLADASRAEGRRVRRRLLVVEPAPAEASDDLDDLFENVPV